MLKRIRLVLFAILILTAYLPSWAQAPVSVSPVTTTEGYDFFVTWLLNGNRGPQDKDLKLQLLISSREANNIVVEYAAGGSQDVNVAAGATQVVDVTNTNVYFDPEKNEVENVAPKGVRVYSKINKKFTVYAVNKIGSNVASTSFDGAHVLPKEALGYEYVIQCNSNDIMATQFSIVSTVQGKTTVTVNLPDGVQTNGGKTGTFTIDKFDKPGQVYLVRSVASETGEGEQTQALINLAGTTICSDQPIAVWSGNQAAVYPASMASTGDFTSDQLLPISHWGKQFIVPMMKYEACTIKRNRLNVSALESNTKVTLGGAGSETWTSEKIGESHEFDMKRNSQSEAGVYVLTADKPVQVYLYSSSAIANADGENTPSDPSATLIPPLEFLTDTATFSMYSPPQPPADANQYEHRIVIWARTSETGNILMDGTAVTGFAPVNGMTGYSYVDKKVEEGTHIVTAPKKCFSGYAYGLANGQAYTYPIGYDFLPVRDSIFLADKNKQWDGKVHTSEWSNKYPEGGGWHMDKVELPKQPTQFDTVFVCDSTQLRFPLKIHNEWDEIKWEVMRINQSNQKRTEYTDDASVRKTGDLTKPVPFIETSFYMLPEKNVAPNRRHPYEDFEVRAILFHKPILCDDNNQDNWPKDTLNAIVRAFRQYNDTTWIIRCDNDPALDKFFLNPETKESQMVIKSPTDTKTYTVTTKTLEYGGDPTPKGKQNTFTERYTTRYSDIVSCDSVVTLKVLLCKSEVEVRQPDYICEEELEDVTKLFKGDFFKDYRLYETLQEYKRTITPANQDQNKDFGDGWIYYGGRTDNLARTWQFKGTDVVRTTDCNPDMQTWHDKYGASWPNNRATIGCDKSLTIELHVLAVVEYTYDAVSCGDKYTWTRIENRANNPKNVDETIYRKDQGKGYSTVERYYTPKSARPGWEGKNCPTEKHILRINFTDGDVIKEIEMCDDDKPLTVSKTNEPDIEDASYTWTFDPTGKGGTTTSSDKIRCVTSDNCVYDLTYKVHVNTVERHEDIFVYCYEDGSRVLHKWDGHRMPWMQEKDQPKTKKHYNDASAPVYLTRNKDKLMVYELTDTTVTSGCHIVYKQTVYMMPVYSTSELHDPISSEQWFEWQGVLWVGDKVNTATVSNPNHLPIGVLKEFGMTPPTPDWRVEYFAGNYTYALTTTTTTIPYKREDGTMTAVCDSTVQLLVQVGEVQRENSYDYTCSNATPYVWYAGGITPDTIHLDNFEGKDYTHITDSITIHKGRYDLKTSMGKRRDGKDPWPVAGMDAYFDHYLTIFPAYVKNYDTIVCQEPGATVVFKEMTFPLDEYGTFEDKNADKQTKPKTWIHPETQQAYQVQCDSGEIARVIVQPIYNENLNKELATHKIVLYTHDTLRFFSAPEVLFVGMDFFTTHPQIPDLNALKLKAGVDSVVFLDAKLVPDLGRTDVDWRVHQSVYECDQLTEGSRIVNGTKVSLCDSTSFLELHIKKAIIHDPEYLGDNGHILGDNTGKTWSFGGDTTTNVTGTKTETFPLITGEYFKFYYDENGNIIGEVPFEEEDATRRNSGAPKDANYSENDDGTRTYLLIDSVWNTITGMYDVHVQAVTVYPTYVINYLKSRQGVDEITVCASDLLTCPWNPSKKIKVRDLPRKDDRIAIYADTLCVERYQNSDGLCVDSILYMKMRVFGNAPIPQTHEHCYNDPPYYWKSVNGNPNYTLPPVVYDPDQYISGPIIDVIHPEDPNITCADTLKYYVNFHPSYGIEDYGDRDTYLDPFVYEKELCQYADYKWVLADGNPDHRLFDENGNPLSSIPTDVIGTFTIYDSLKTKGCKCDSVLTLHYEVKEAKQPKDTFITACDRETMNFRGIEIPIDINMENPMTITIDNGSGCPETFILHFTIERLTSFFNVKAEPICYGPYNPDGTFRITYSFRGDYAPTTYSIYYSDRTKDSLHINNDLLDRTIMPAIDMNTWKPDSVYEIWVSLPEIREKEDYPTPGMYDAIIGFNNGHCAGDADMSYALDLDVRYPEWIMEQRHNDLIVLLDSVDNGHRSFKAFQWYKDGRLMEGYTQPYLYIPGGLEVGASYHVSLTELNAQGDTVTVSPTCPIVAEASPDAGPGVDTDHGPTSDYISVTPTCVPVGRTAIHILAHDENSRGTYRITTIEGQYVSSGEYSGEAMQISIPAVEGMYIVQVRSANQEAIESYRAIKVVVGDICQE